ncbi:phage minor capsid protein [Liquorilactobacillus mali]|uniref:Minor capsid protein n=1 Tax=Liquorilactobacillus mali KCTC 3596 = DSM 20444 TaxID=1046596 RepID=J0L3J8_9LACO|nr:phage minor capsid protein [Liquorilactobacillus mali]EJE97703.1 minor capsid protein1 [Liquorilactobacillus mali KCTC 3596 = DSM 20444]KRN08803.1 minor capsid protein [Liquorilactobacillus mali KCTC 3596 = DSM 20444]QFQ75152.1 capsid protein [Liquorilactobacillus mali]
MSSNNYADLIINMYSSLQQNIFNIIINALKSSSYKDINKDNIMQWQLEQFAKAGKLTDQVINEVAKVNNKTPAAIKEMCQQLGYSAVKTTQDEIKRNTTKAGNLSPDSKGIINSYINQTWQSLYNNINESLLTRNIATNSATQIYRDIITKSTIEVSSGFKTHEQAIRDNMYRWVDKGIPTRLTDRAGKGWSLEGYARTVINTTNHRVVNELRNQTMNVNKVTLAKMSWHPCARPACAPIQGHVVNMVPPESPDYDSKYDSIYNHGYGKPAGVQGINCGHIFTPFDPKINIDHKDSDMPSPATAQKQGDIQQKQRSMERAIRQTKKKMNAAEMLGDKSGVNHFKSTLSNQQARVRELIKSNDFLNRDYSREQIQSK